MLRGSDFGDFSGFEAEIEIDGAEAETGDSCHGFRNSRRKGNEK
ncbi:hypothetical protein TIFTF001_027516 [Ficus carica]|uniref:Uncharacterized protein n=1 Tax=Ficus carica TaxID=3494 RepID=A0AA88J0D3_FICCA|nr:hypothetical protein TIFTF001_027516 [Ficus carica]